MTGVPRNMRPEKEVTPTRQCHRRRNDHVALEFVPAPYEDAAHGSHTRGRLHEAVVTRPRRPSEGSPRFGDFREPGRLLQRQPQPVWDALQFCIGVPTAHDRAIAREMTNSRPEESASIPWRAGRLMRFARRVGRRVRPRGHWQSTRSPTSLARPRRRALNASAVGRESRHTTSRSDVARTTLRFLGKWRHGWTRLAIPHVHARRSSTLAARRRESTPSVDNGQHANLPRPRPPEWRQNGADVGDTFAVPENGLSEPWSRLGSGHLSVGASQIATSRRPRSPLSLLAQAKSID